MLRVLPSSRRPGLWLTGLGVAWLLDIDAVRAVELLDGLQAARLVCHDEREPWAYARTRAGDELVEAGL